MDYSFSRLTFAAIDEMQEKNMRRNKDAATQRTYGELTCNINLFFQSCCIYFDLRMLENTSVKS
jgi:hypothetical protein